MAHQVPRYGHRHTTNARPMRVPQIPRAINTTSHFVLRHPILLRIPSSFTRQFPRLMRSTPSKPKQPHENATENTLATPPVAHRPYNCLCRSERSQESDILRRNYAQGQSFSCLPYPTRRYASIVHLPRIESLLSPTWSTATAMVQLHGGREHNEKSLGDANHYSFLPPWLTLSPIAFSGGPAEICLLLFSSESMQCVSSALFSRHKFPAGDHRRPYPGIKSWSSTIGSDVRGRHRPGGDLISLIPIICRLPGYRADRHRITLISLIITSCFLLMPNDCDHGSLRSSENEGGPSLGKLPVTVFAPE